MSLFDDDFEINPATGLPMVGWIDTAGNPYGCNFSNDDFFSSSTFGIDDTFSSGIDDTFGSGSFGSGFDDW